jgi:hypothetical protein
MAGLPGVVNRLEDMTPLKDPAFGVLFEKLF